MQVRPAPRTAPAGGSPPRSAPGPTGRSVIRPACSVPAMPDREVDYLLIGGGLASANCARWLREEGADGSILIVGREPDPPYNRPDCSKGYLRGEESRDEPLFRPEAFWSAENIELLTRTTVTGLDLEARTAKLSTKQEVAVDQALIATGANVRRFNLEGCDPQLPHYLP